ncbi:MAG: cold shock domain-containing protein [Bacteroidales bacterium]|jgi:cold shock CspA family protein|nr:cold shock domain-containing protein [Bacteroidales bacterium]
MGRSQESFGKKEVRNKRAKKRKEKEEKRQARKEQGKNSFDDMIAYVDEFGNITSSPPDPKKRTEINPEDIVLGAATREPESEEDRIRKGVVTFFNQSKGFGFIRDLVTGESIFVHINNLNEPVEEGTKVTFERGAGQKGPAAMNVRIVV